jgi:hypothetical protein
MTIKASTVLVDRLEHALDKQGVKMKRRALLETAAYAFAYGSSNAFTAASAKGDINPPPVKVIGRLELPDGQVLIVVDDPLAGAPYGIDEAFVERVVDEERREAIGITPYGHLVRIDQVSETEMDDLGTSGPNEDLSSITAIIHAAKNRIDGYTAHEPAVDRTGQAEVDTVGQAELALTRAFDAADFGNRGQTIRELRNADELLSMVRNDDAERHVMWTRQTIGEALDSIKAIRPKPRTDGDAALKPFLLAALEQIDQEIDNRKAGGDPATWADMQKVSDLGHAAARNAAGLLPLEDDEDSIRVSRADLKLLLGAAQAHSDDVNSGVEDGTYDEAENEGIDDVDDAIGSIEARLEMPYMPKSVREDGPKAGRITVHVARIVHAHGSDVRVALTASGLDAEVAKYCRESWKEISDRKGVPANTIGMTDQEVVSMYYDQMENAESEEFVEESTFDLPLPDAASSTPTASKPTLCGRCGSALKADGLCPDETCPFSDRVQGDPQGWAGHPDRDPAPRDDAAAVPTSALAGFANADEIASELEDAANADIWYDAHDHGDPEDEEDADRIAENSIERAQNAMIAAARILRDLKPVVLPDGGIIVDGVIQSKTRIAERAKRDASDEVRYITYQNGDLGDVTISMLAAMGLPYHNDRGDSLPLTEDEYEWLGTDETLNDDGALPVSLGASALWRRRKWLVAEIEFSYADQGDDSRDDAAALRRAHAHMEHLAPYMESLGGHMVLDEDATEFGHELAILIPFEIAMQSASWNDWTRALSYLLSTEAEKKAGPQVSAEYTAQQEVGRGVYSVEPTGDTVWDATFDALRWGRKHADDIYHGTASYPDEYAHSTMAPKWVQERSGVHPFEVQAIGLGTLYGIEGTDD